MIKAIITDFGGVLSEQGTLEPWAYARADKYGVDAQELEELISRDVGQACLNEIADHDFWQSLADFVGDNVLAMKKDIFQWFGFRKEVWEFFKSLKPNYKLGFLSNQIEDWLDSVIAEHKMDEVFDAIVTSYGARLVKPDLAIYQKILEEIKEPGENCVFIDDLAKNMPPAESLGIKTILYKDFEQMKKELKDFGVKF